MTKSEENKLIKKVEAYWSVAKEGQASYRRKWKERYKYWKNQEKIARPKEKDNVRIPLIFEISDGIDFCPGSKRR